MRTGTNHFVSIEAAIEYYANYGYDRTDVERKIADGEIAIGAPCLCDTLIKRKQRIVTIDRGSRYAIEDID